MKKIDDLTGTAFVNKKRFKLRNTKIEIVGGKPYLYLHNNLIAKMNDNDEILINHCGWQTVTTRARLNSLPGVHIRIFKGEFILNEMGYMKQEWINTSKL